jgi:[ribosomal protein S18]-alanine N-acetyltransferase
MITDVNISCRHVREADRQRLANLVHFEPYVHRHLDWRAPLDWIGHQPFLAAERGDRLVGAIACPPDPPGVAWIRLFAIASGIEASETWSKLWSGVLDIFNLQGYVFIGAIPLQNWFKNLLKASGFQQVNEVTLMTWNRAAHPFAIPNPELSLRPMNFDDLTLIEDLDKRSFGPIWHNSKSALELAYRQAVLATVAELDGQIFGYQISTALQKGGHLARLAVEPKYQRKGIGAALLEDLLAQFKRRGAVNVTVNTQIDNKASIALYERFGFRKTGEAYPVYQYQP